MYVHISMFPLFFSFSLVPHDVLLGMKKQYVEISTSPILLDFSSMERNIQTGRIFVSHKRLIFGHDATSAPPWDWIVGLGDLLRRSDEIRWQMERKLIWALLWFSILAIVLMRYFVCYWAVTLSGRGNLWKSGGYVIPSNFRIRPIVIQQSMVHLPCTGVCWDMTSLGIFLILPRRISNREHCTVKNVL